MRAEIAKLLVTLAQQPSMLHSHTTKQRPLTLAGRIVIMSSTKNPDDGS